MSAPLPLNVNLTAERPTFVTHLECGLTGERVEADVLHGLSTAGRPLLVRYDLGGVAASINKAGMAERPRDRWRWREPLPVRRTDNIISLGEGRTATSLPLRTKPDSDEQDKTASPSLSSPRRGSKAGH